jgi:oxygen-independent coproporphyrinogen-3 oxidase
LRTVRHRKPENFLSAIARNDNGISQEEPLSRREAADEALVMGLRLTEGIDPGALEKRFGVKIADPNAIQRLIATGHLAQSGPRVAATPAGRLVLDSLLGQIAAA